MTGDWIFPAVLSVLFVLLGLFAFALDEYPAVSLFFDRPARRRKRDLALWEAEFEADSHEAL